MFLSGADVARFLDFDSCVLAVEKAFAMHAKTGGLKLERTYFGLKVNCCFFDNPRKNGLPTIQGLMLLCDGTVGTPLAIMDSSEITRVRTGAATSVAAKYLARKDSSVATICGSGTQARMQLRALKHVLPIQRAFVYGRDQQKASKAASELSEELSIEVSVASELNEAVRQSDVIATCTPSRSPLLLKDNVSPGTFIAAVGSDSPDKQELEPSLVSSSKFVADILEQSERVGELHHAIDAGKITPADVHAELGEIIIGNKPGRSSDSEVTIFDSTGTALQDVAAAALVYELAKIETNSSCASQDGPIR